MARKPILTASEAAALVKDGMTITTSGFVGSCMPEALTKALEQRFLTTNSPQNLTFVYSSAQGNHDGSGADHFAHEGMTRRVIGGHWNLAPQLGRMVLENKIEGYNLPQGVLCKLYRDIASRSLGHITHVGIGTFVDPRIEGGKLNRMTQEDLIEVIHINGQERLLFKAIPLDIAFIRGTYADESGNVTLEREVASLEATSMAQAVHNCGGKVIVQVERLVQDGTLDPRLVKIPGIYVDGIVVCKVPDDHAQSLGCEYDGSMCGEFRATISNGNPVPLSAKKIIGRRAAMELSAGKVVNLGIGAPEYVALVAGEEGISNCITLTVEGGPVGGIPQAGVRFGACVNAECILDQPYQFDFYDGGGLDLCFLGLAEVDNNGDVNVSRLGTRITGSGGFTNISSNSKKAVFCGTFTNGVKIQTGDGKLTILEEGKKHKFVKKVTEITFSGVVAGKAGKDVLYVTERAVFALKADGIHLIEVAPGIDVQTQVLDEMDFEPIVDRDADGNVKLMDARIFKDEVMGMTIE